MVSFFLWKSAEEPSVLNAVVLVAGTTVGAGILALPAVTQPVGFVPSMAALSFSWRLGFGFWFGVNLGVSNIVVLLFVFCRCRNMPACFRFSC